MRNQRASRRGLMWACLLIAASLAPSAPPGPVLDANSDAIKAAAQAKIKAANEILAMCREFLIAPPGERGTPAPLEVAEQIQFWSRQLTEARLEAAEDKDERLKILTEAFDRAKGFDSEVKELTGNEASGLTKLSAAKATYYRVDAEVQLLKEKSAANR